MKVERVEKVEVTNKLELSDAEFDVLSLVISNVSAAKAREFGLSAAQDRLLTQMYGEMEA